MGTQVICKKAIVSGRVQGVFYRATAAHKARELGIQGHARNLADGCVEILACGEAQRVAAFIDWLWVGSSASKVTAVQASELPLEPDQLPAGFSTG